MSNPTKIQAFGRYFRGGSPVYATPPPFFEYWNRRLHFDRDVAADASNTKCRKFWTKETDALAQVWNIEAGPVFFMNCPYSRPKDVSIADWGGTSGLFRWVRHARVSTYLFGVTVGAVLPAWTGDFWWHRFMKDAEINFIRKKLTFKSPTRDVNNQAGFDTVFVVFRPDDKERGQRIKYVTCPVK